MAARDVTGLRILHAEAERYPPEAMELLRSVGEVDTIAAATQEDFVAALAARAYDAVVVRLGLALDRGALDAAPDLRYAVTATTGLDHIDLDAAAARGVRIVSLRGEIDLLRTVASTAEHTWALLLALVRGLAGAAGDVLRGRWAPTSYACGEVAGATLGIVGFGRLGRLVAGYGAAFGMTVLAHDRDPDGVRAAGYEAVGAEALLARADVVSLHLSLDETTSGWLSRERIAAMRPAALLVNTARGELVDQAALLDALQRGAIAGAALDVLAGDSRWDGGVPAGHPLVAYAATHPNLIITPHIGGAGIRSVARTRLHVARRFVDAVRAAGGRTS